mgnify:CR=1 FL=1
MKEVNIFSKIYHQYYEIVLLIFLFSFILVFQQL